MKYKQDHGFSLVECLVAITILGALIVPTCTSLLLSLRMNDKAESMLQAQLAVSSAVETLLAEGISKASGETDPYTTALLDGIAVEVHTFVPQELSGNGNPPYYTVTITSNAEQEVSVTMAIHAASGGDSSS